MKERAHAPPIIALARGRTGLRAALVAAALIALVLVALGGARAAARALDRREDALRAENAWLRARLAAMDARLRELESRADVGASAVALPDAAPDRAAPSRLPAR